MSGPAKADGKAAPDEYGVPIAREIEIINKKGLHARASAKFVQTAEQFDAAIIVTRGHETVGGTSIMGLMMLGAATHTTITIQATGKEAAPAVEALCALVAGKFGEEE
jgi:phosphocarrier protein HPr